MNIDEIISKLNKLNDEKHQTTRVIKTYLEFLDLKIQRFSLNDSPTYDEDYWKDFVSLLSFDREKLTDLILVNEAKLTEINKEIKEMEDKFNG